MQYDDVAERGGVASSSKSWNAELGVVASWACRSDAGGQRRLMYGTEGTNSAWKVMDRDSDFIAARMLIKSYGLDLFASRKAINT